VSTPLNRPPQWVGDAVFYQIFPDRFARSDRVPKPSNLEGWDVEPTSHGFKGGDLGGVIEHLDWIVELGATAIWFNPIFQSASNHRYHTHDYDKIDPLLGDLDLFTELVEACHDRNIKVVLDGVFNHCSRGFFQFNDILENGEQSPWLDWFTVNDFPLNAYDMDGHKYESWKDLPALPEFNTDNPAVREYLYTAAERWSRLGIDGWRLDVPAEITTPGFWEEFRERLRSVNPNLYFVSEIWEDASDWTNDGDRFDGTMNYWFGGAALGFAAGDRIVPEMVAGQPWEEFVRPLDAGSYRKVIEDILGSYSEEATRANLSLWSSHDTARVLSTAGGDLDSVRLAALLLFTFPGAPCLYYGEEIGMKGGPEPGSRGGFPWDNPDSWDRQLLATYRDLITLRHNHPAMRSLSYETVTAEGQLYAFVRADPAEKLLVVVNASNGTASTNVAGLVGATRLLYGDGEASAGIDGLQVALPARSGAVWIIED
jgi:neopullulanase